MALGIPCSLYTWSRNTVATLCALKGWTKGMKWAYFDRLSITTRMQLAEWDLGKLSMKSMDTICQHWLGIARGCRRPGYLARSGFACWHTRQVLTKCRIVVFIASHSKYCFICWYVTVKPECPPMALSCNADITLWWSNALEPNHTFPLNRVSHLSVWSWVWNLVIQIIMWSTLVLLGSLDSLWPLPVTILPGHW